LLKFANSILLKIRTIPCVEIGTVDFNRADLTAKLKDFALLYDRRPIHDNFGGMNSAHMFYVWFLTKHLQPRFIIESGVFKGQSTWLFEVSAPDAKIISLDPKLEQREYISPNVEYHSEDFLNIDWTKIDKERTLCFFDDHYGIDRIKQCYEFGFRHILYEDNYPHPGGCQFHPSGDSMSPKAAFHTDRKEAEFLRSIMEVYYEFPPIFPNLTNRRVNKQWKKLYAQPLIDKIKEEPLRIYAEEAWNYTWICYVRLKQKA
jgi:hypothetical protein